MTRVIVIAVDPDTGGRVAPIGVELARRLDARLVLAHVRKDPPLFSSLRDREGARLRNERRGRQVLDRERAALPLELDVEKRVAHGGVVSTLGDIAEEVGATLIVVGSRGRGAVASALFGSISQTLAREAPCPVMIVPEAPTGTRRPFEEGSGERATMVAAADSSASSSVAARFARALADGLDHRLVVVRLRDRGGSRADALQAIAAIERAQTIVIAADLRAGGRFQFGRSFAARLARVARCPVIVVPTGATVTLDAVRETTVGAAPQSATGG